MSGEQMARHIKSIKTVDCEGKLFVLRMESGLSES